MSQVFQRMSYVNGRYLPHAQAKVHIEDRGYQFSDGIYEVMLLANGVLVDEQLHMKRLEHSLKELAMDAPVSLDALRLVIHESIRVNRLKHGSIYLQISRGVAPRNHVFPKGNVKPSIVVTVQRPKPSSYQTHGAKAITMPDIRWGRRDIKSISLLPNVIAKNEAFLQGALESILIDSKGIVTEGSTSNCFIVNSEGELQTHPKTEAILWGITREVVIQLAKKAGIAVVEKPFNAAALAKASECFISSSTAKIVPIISIDGSPVAQGKIGSITKKLIMLYDKHVEQSAR